MPYSHEASMVATRAPDGTDFYPLGVVGHVSGLSWSSALPGGPDGLSCLLEASPSSRHPAFNPGRVVEVYRGASKVWEGILNEPAPVANGWQITADGAGHYGDRFLAVWTAWDANNAVNAAISRGLRWLNPGLPGGLYLAEQADSGSMTITDFMNMLTRPGSYTWQVGRRNTLSAFAVPTAPTRILMSASPAARTLAGYINALYGRYQSADDNTDTGTAASYGLVSATNAASITKHQRSEAFWDISGAGTISSGTATAYIAAALAQYMAASWSGPIVVRYGRYLTMGGVPVDLGCEKAGEVVLMMLADGPYGGEVGPSPPVTFPVGKIEYSDEDHTAAITPFQSVPGDLQGLLSSLALKLPRPAAPTETA